LATDTLATLAYTVSRLSGWRITTIGTPSALLVIAATVPLSAALTAAPGVPLMLMPSFLPLE
jgi:hypothetical protein